MDITEIKDDQQLNLPPGFRFHPTDEELISHYLFHKVMNTGFSTRAITDVDLNKSEPWDLPWKAKMGEKEWYFFCVRDRKYPTGLRTNRATEAGYWKATGKDKDIYRDKSLVGMKKTLVFYRGRAPKGEKSGWVMHEYRLEGKFSALNLPITAKNEWVICRVFQKNANGKKVDISGMSKLGSFVNEFEHLILPPLRDSVESVNNVPCFSIAMDSQRKLQPMASSFNDSNSIYSPPNQTFSVPHNLQFSGSVLFQEQHSLLRALLHTVNGGNSRDSFKSEMDYSRQAPPASMAPIDLDGFWNY